jgi:C4-dicarboxylate-specific signal transduction histidine kinase
MMTNQPFVSETPAHRRSTASVAAVSLGFPMILTNTVFGGVIAYHLDFRLALATAVIGNAILLMYVGTLSYLARTTRRNLLDLTGRKQAEREARESEERYREVHMELAHANRVATMGQLTASIAHEVKQPIGAVVACAEAALRFLARQPPELEKARQALEGVVETSRRAGNVIERIRTLMKKAPPRNERLDMNEAIREVIELTRGEAAKDGVSVQMDLAHGLPLVEGDRVQLQQVLLNLTINALESMSSVSDGTRELLISTRSAEPGGVLIGVRDSGLGLTEGTLERLFDAFYTTKPGGLGLGLSICRSIIETHGGRLWATANVPRGAIFEFTVPAHSDGAL